jgi:tight adherence protein C
MMSNGSAKISRRQVVYELPYAIELMALCCASGTSLMNAIEAVGDSQYDNVARVFKSAYTSFSAGMPRDEVFHRLRTDLGTSSAASLVSAIKQADSGGTPITSILSVHAESARQEEYLEKMRQVELVPLKLAVCTALLLFPALVLVAIGPHIVTFINSGW